MQNTWTFALLCSTLLGVSHASPSPIVAARAGCPTPISNVNGGFESGQFAPWTVTGPTTPAGITQQVATPGFNGSAYALHVHFPETPVGSILEYGISEQTTGQECFNDYYSITYSWNWNDYSGAEGPHGASWCKFTGSTGYTDGIVEHYAYKGAKWHVNNYVGQDIYSHGAPAIGSFGGSVTCVANDTAIPAFTMFLDNFHITNAIVVTPF